MNTIEDKNKLMVMIDNGIKEIPFEFTIPIDAYPSYKGKFATITYQIKATADRENWLDKNKKITFSVINSKHKANHIITNENNDNILRTNSLDFRHTIPDNKQRNFFDNLCINGIKGTEKSHEAFDKMNYNSSRYRDNFIKENSESTVEFIRTNNENNPNNRIERINIHSYSPGQ